MASAIDYKDINTDKDKLAAIYSLEEQFRQEHNRVGAEALKDWENNNLKWREYTLRYREKVAPILHERARLKEAIRKATYSDNAWREIPDSQKYTQEFVSNLWGDKSVLKELPTKVTCNELIELKQIKLSDDAKFTDPVQNFGSDWTEVDTPGYLTVSGDTITGTNLGTSEAYVYRDFGANHFGEFEHLISTYCGTLGAVNSFFGVWAIGDEYGDHDDHSSGFCVFRLNAGGTHAMLLASYNGGGYDFYSFSDGVTKYLTIDRVGSTVHNYIYSNSSRTTLNDTEVLTSQDTDTYRYLCCGFSDTGGAGTASGTVFDLDLQEGSGNVTVSPSPATAVASRQNPTVIEPVTVSPSPATAVASKVDPNVVVGGNVTVAPNPATAVASRENPSVQVGANVTVAPGPVSAIAGGVDPNVLAGGNLTISPSPAYAIASRVNPTVQAGGLTPALWDFFTWG